MRWLEIDITVVKPFTAAMTKVACHSPLLAAATVGAGGSHTLDAVDQFDEEGPEGGAAGGPDNDVDFVAVEKSRGLSVGNCPGMDCWNVDVIREGLTHSK